MRCDQVHRELDSLKNDRAEDMVEVTPRVLRRGNVVFSGVPEADQGSPKQRINSDKGRPKSIFEELGCHDVISNEITRLGLINSGKHRLLKISLQNEKKKRKILRNASKLKVSKSTWMKNVNMNLDWTKWERERDILLCNEMRFRRQAGERVFIRSGKVGSKFLQKVVSVS